MAESHQVPELDRRMAVLSPHLYDGVPLTESSRRAGVPIRTARRWLASYREGGGAGLMRPRRLDRHGRRISDQLVKVIEGLALRRSPPQFAQIHRQVAELAEKQGLAAPSYQSVRRIVRGLDADLLALAHGSRDAPPRPGPLPADPAGARRCLKRRLANHLWRVMTADEKKAAGAGPGGHLGATTESSAADPTPTVSSSD